MQDNGWDHGLTVTADGKGLVGHAGGMLLRKLADQCGLTAELDAALAHPVLGAAPSGSTVRRVLNLASDRVLLKVAQARARIRRHVWDLIEAAGGFPWLEVAGRSLEGWVVIDMDGTLITAHSDKENAAPTWKKGYGPSPRRVVHEHPRVPGHAAALRQRRVEHLHRPQGGPGPGAEAGPGSVPAQDPGPDRRRRSQPRPGRAPAHPHHEAQGPAVHLRLDDHRKRRAGHRRSSRRRVGPGVRQDGTVEEDKDVAEITHLMSRAEIWPEGLRFIARRVRPSRRHKNMTAYEKKTGWKYSITCTNIPHTGIPGVPGSQHPQFIDVTHRDHATVETDGVRTAKAMGLRNLPSKAWQVNKGWTLAANIAADLTSWARLIGFHDQPELKNAEPDTLRYRIWHLPARLVRHARKRNLKISPGWPWNNAFITCWNRLCALPALS